MRRQISLFMDVLVGGEDGTAGPQCALPRREYAPRGLARIQAGCSVHGVALRSGTAVGANAMVTRGLSRNSIAAGVRPQLIWIHAAFAPGESDQ